MDKVIRDGKVAVLYSPSYGAGWYTWNSEYPQAIFDPEIVNILLSLPEPDYSRQYHSDEVISKIENIASNKYNGFYTGGADTLTVYWVKRGEQFEITEYDGYESVNVIGECSYLVA
jgi:hypothetical protein